MQILLRLSAVALGLAALVWMLGYGMTHAPGSSPVAPAALSSDEDTRAERLQEHVDLLAKEIGERRTRNMTNLRRASQHLWDTLRRARLDPREESVVVDGNSLSVVVADLPGQARAEEIVLVAAHYDSQAQSPGADDDASGCAVALELARELAGTSLSRTLRFAFFPNGSEPWAGTSRTASRHWAAEHAQGVVAALVLEGLGCYSSAPGSQDLPPPLSWFHRDRADYLGFQADLASRELLMRVVASFRGAGRLPAESLLVPSWVPGTLDADHQGLAKAGIPVVLVTDTLAWRSEHVGTGFDTPDRLDYASMARATTGLLAVLEALGR